jgi:hypothetical protein
MAEESRMYKWFWRKMGELTQSRPLTPAAVAQRKEEDARERFKRFKAELGMLNDFLSEAKKLLGEFERAGADVTWAQSYVTRLAAPINILNNVIGATDEAIEAAEQVSLGLATWYKHATDQARLQAGGDDDQYFIISAQIDRQWQARNVKAVLSTENKDSFVMRLWPKWKDRILKLVF